MAITIYKNPETDELMIVGSLDATPDTSIEKIGEILYEYCQKIGISNPDVRVWSKEDISGV